MPADGFFYGKILSVFNNSLIFIVYNDRYELINHFKNMAEEKNINIIALVGAVALIVIVAAVLLRLGLGSLTYGRAAAANKPVAVTVNDRPGAVSGGGQSALTAEPGNTIEIKTFEISSSNYSYSPAEIRVKEGYWINIIFTNKDGFHDWVLDEFNARTGRINAGETATIEFIADKKGTFEYYCSVGQHRQMGMVGKLIVE